MLTLEQALKLRKRNFTDEIGIVFTKLENGCAEGQILIEKFHSNFRGTVHGGCIFSLMDSVAGLASLSTGSYAATSSSNVQYLNPAKDTSLIKARAKPVKLGRLLMVFDVEVSDDADMLIAKGIFTFVRLGDVEGLK
jgi:acyl-CoA thioesterase